MERGKKRKRKRNRRRRRDGGAEGEGGKKDRNGMLTARKFCK